ncbi:hypothetical protein ONA91_34135 [Micromonospora sp. DR5-3]|uniref:hypothetical protein n=1 Tax=unclassified Micromonospora TaxID=2617518 RepID=UPI0011D418D7|nr:MULTISPECIES: hypothetical protein [unclassified Micromonospora]MCW3819494.1 hypothetical protein [Micromonospora sp. DR5-3]TYC21315.1 hypothetical protein FXF52_26540 [Micromonospora sp. MP36]
MHGLSAIDGDRRIRPARTRAPLTAHPTAPRAGGAPAYPTVRRAAARPGAAGASGVIAEPAAERGRAVHR